MLTEKFEFALQQLKPSQWEKFEELSSSFLSDEYPNLRTLAAPGDGGRDAILRQPGDDATVALQYSIAQDWHSKILATARTLSAKHESVGVLIYLSNQRIGARADELATTVRKEYKIYLDIRDLSWFKERVHRSTTTAAAAEQFSNPIIEPLLVESGLLSSRNAGMELAEARVALVFLAMHWEDETREKGLTKLSFDALVKAVLRETDNQQRMSREQVCDAVCRILSNTDVEEVRRQTNLAIERLKGRTLRHWKQEDEFCLAFAERTRLTESLVQLELTDNELNSELLDIMVRVAQARSEDEPDTGALASLIPLIRRTIETFLLQRGEAFVTSIAAGQTTLFTDGELRALCLGHIEGREPAGWTQGDAIDMAIRVVDEVLVDPSIGVQKYLRALADSYTLFAFLRQMPDVQQTIRKMYSHGKIWLDTTAVLPLLSETLLPSEKRRYTRTLEAASDAGMQLFVTPGVLDEVLHHIEHARRCQGYGPNWRSRVPFLFAAYLWSGRDAAEFRSWTVEFMGGRNPEDDLADFLRHVAKIECKSLHAYVEGVDENLKWRVEAYWQQVHLARSQAADGSRDTEVAKQLADNDVENFLGIVSAREHQDRTSSLGHEYWWLTLDRRAYRAADEIAEDEDVEPFESPVISYDFLINYMSIGPRRANVFDVHKDLLPVMLDMGLLHEVPRDIVKIADSAREEMKDRSELVVRREVRDRLDRARMRLGPTARHGLDAIEADLREALAAESEVRPTQ